MVYIIKFLDEEIISPFLCISLVFCALYLLFKILPYIFIRHKNNTSKFTCATDKKSMLSSLVLALSGTLGVGNITGVASALISGGIGAIFWMWVSAILSSVLKFSEVTLSMNSKKNNISGAISYILPLKHGKIVATIFSVMCIISSFFIGNQIQLNASYLFLENTFGFNKIIIATLFFVIIFSVTYGGKKRIIKFSEAVIPLLSVIYITFCLIVIFKNIRLLPDIFTVIVKDAFNFKSASAGIGGVIINRSMRLGISRGIASNEAGCGTSPFAHATSDNPALIQGVIGIVEVLIDTIVFCSLTAFVILLSGKYGSTQNEALLVIISFEKFFGNISSIMLSICTVFFAVSSSVCWSFYGLCSLDFIVKNDKRKRMYEKTYILMFAFASFLSVLIKSEILWNLSDITLGVMTIINIFALVIQSRKLKEIILKF